MDCWDIDCVGLLNINYGQTNYKILKNRVLNYMRHPVTHFLEISYRTLFPGIIKQIDNSSYELITDPIVIPVIHNANSFSSLVSVSNVFINPVGPLAGYPAPGDTVEIFVTFLLNTQTLNTTPVRYTAIIDANARATIPQIHIPINFKILAGSYNVEMKFDVKRTLPSVLNFTQDDYTTSFTSSSFDVHTV